MIQIFCNHCGKGIKGEEIKELTSCDCYVDAETGKVVGSGCTLCAQCMSLREKAHILLDKEFLHIAGG